ncbi:MAG: hypothetical protein HC828_03965 [Blastochloris sp.]|nr:hypothetical protein [Blastochloris sp.]
MTERMTPTDLLTHLLTQVRASPLFGTVYAAVPLSVLADRVQTLAQRFSPLLRATLAEGMPDVPEQRVDDLVGRITPRVVLVCALLAVEEPLAEPLYQVALILALLYWADDCLDQGDAAMAASLQAWIARTTRPSNDAPIQTRMMVLASLDQRLTQLALPLDAAALAGMSIRPFLTHAYALHCLRQRATQINPVVFWQRYTQSFVVHVVESIQLPGTLFLLYALYRRRQPDLPSVADLATDSQLLPLLATLGNMVLRVCDDAGDYDHDQQTGTLNMFTHPQPPVLVAALWGAAGLPIDHAQAALVRVWQQDTPASRRHVVTYLTKVFQSHVAAAAPQVPPTAQWLLTLTRRMVLLSALVATGDL